MLFSEHADEWYQRSYNGYYSRKLEISQEDESNVLRSLLNVKRHPIRLEKDFTRACMLQYLQRQNTKPVLSSLKRSNDDEIHDDCTHKRHTENNKIVLEFFTWRKVFRVFCSDTYTMIW